MNCPICKTVELTAANLDGTLPAHACSQCGGTWLSSVEYWRWLEAHGPALPEKVYDGPPIRADDNSKIKICPECSRLMLRYTVGHGTGIGLDQCGTCNGVWFDRGEWDVLKARNLHDEVNLVFTAPWQNAVRKDEARARLEAAYRRRFGGDYEEIKRIREWIYCHAERDELLAYLTDPEPYRSGI